MKGDLQGNTIKKTLCDVRIRAMKNKQAYARRVVITGLGVVAPNGIGKEIFWDACISGRSGIGRITRFDASGFPIQIAGEVTNFCPEALGLSEDECKTLDLASQYAIAAANLAMQD